jgi:hypothetical protein
MAFFSRERGRPVGVLQVGGWGAGLLDEVRQALMQQVIKRNTAEGVGGEVAPYYAGTSELLMF